MRTLLVLITIARLGFGFFENFEDYDPNTPINQCGQWMGNAVVNALQGTNWVLCYPGHTWAKHYVDITGSYFATTSVDTRVSSGHYLSYVTIRWYDDTISAVLDPQNGWVYLKSGTWESAKSPVLVVGQRVNVTLVYNRVSGKVDLWYDGVLLRTVDWISHGSTTPVITAIELSSSDQCRYDDVTVDPGETSLSALSWAGIKASF